MNIGILKEIVGDRVLITPDTSKVLIKQGHNVFISSDAAIDSGYTNEDYLNNGVKILKNNLKVIDKCNLLTSYRMPSSELLSGLNKKHTLLAYSNIVKNIDKANAISISGATLIGMEFIENNGEREISKKIAQLVSKISFNMISYFYNKPINGSGNILDNIPFTEKTNVTILGHGYIGKEIAKIFSKKNCAVSIFDKNVNAFNNMDDIGASCFHVNDSRLENTILNSEIIISTISNPLHPTQQFISTDFVKKIKNNSLIFDLSINNGGTFETSKETTMNNPVFMFNNVMHCCPSDILQKTGKTFSDYIGNSILSYILLLAEGYSDMPCFSNAKIINKGTILSDISFIKTKDSKVLRITDPFDLMDSEVSQTWKYADDLNNLLDEIDDYDSDI